MFELSLSLTAAEGALVRVLGLIERRGFPLAGIDAAKGSQGLRMQVRVADCGRPVDVLLRQLKRLPDVREASVAVARPAFSLPAGAIRSAPHPAIKPSRSGLSWLGIPDRVSPEVVTA